MHADLILIGGGGHALVVAEAAELAGRTVLGFLDDDSEAVLADRPTPHLRLGPLVRASAAPDLAPISAAGRSFFRPAAQAQAHPALVLSTGHPESPNPAWILALGDLSTRRELLTEAWPWPIADPVVHPLAFVSPSATLDPGVFVGPGAVVHSRAHIGPHAILNSGCIIEHECLVGENAHIAPGAVLGGRVRVGPNALIGLGARLLPCVRIGAGARVGAGSAVVADVPDNATYAGVPARSVS